MHKAGDTREERCAAYPATPASLTIAARVGLVRAALSMATDQTQVAALLAALSESLVAGPPRALSLTSLLAGGAQRPGVTPAQLPPGFAGLGVPTAQGPPPANSPPGYGLPQPSQSGSLDLSKIKPSQSGKVTLDDAIATAKAKAQAMGVTPGYRDGARTFTPRRADADAVGLLTLCS